MRRGIVKLFGGIVLTMLACTNLAGQRGENFRLENDNISAVITRAGMTSVVSPKDPYRANVVGQGA